MFGLEKSPEALAVAQENAQRLLGEPLPSFLADVLDRRTWADIPELDGIVSNPPYIPDNERRLVPEHVAEHEPSLALFVHGGDPLLFYRAIADLAAEKLCSDGALFFECNEFNALQVAQMLREKGFHTVECRKDLAGADRMVGARKL
jgi:Methylase of polypeptide chain release factors